MKHISKLLVIIFLSFISIGKIYPQDSLLSKPEIKNYIQFLEKENGKLSEKDLRSQPLDSIKKIASLCYQAFDKDYIGMRRYLKSRKGLTGGTFPAISKLLGKKISALIQISYLLEMKINSINTVQFHSHSGFTYPRVQISATVLDAIKGINKFKPGDSITFVYNLDEGMTSDKFQKDEKVFAGISISDVNNVITNYLLLGNPYDIGNSNYGRYPIENGMLIDKDNVWGYGKSVLWEEFKRKLTQDINNIILGK